GARAAPGEFGAGGIALDAIEKGEPGLLEVDVDLVHAARNWGAGGPECQRGRRADGRTGGRAEGGRGERRTRNYRRACACRKRWRRYGPETARKVCSYTPESERRRAMDMMAPTEIDPLVTL